MLYRQLITSNRKGSALVLSVLAIVMLLVMGGALLALGLSSRVYYIRTSSDIAARCAADAGLTKAIYEINQKFQAGDLSELPQEQSVALEGCSAAYSYQIVQQSGGNYVIQATGTSNNAQRTVQAELKMTNPFDFAVFAQESMSMANSATIDWYNYDGDDPSLKVGTNSTQNGAVGLKNSAEIYGDVVVGPGGDPDSVISKKNSAEIYGDTYAQVQSNILPSVNVPTYLQVLPSGGDLTTDTIITNSGKYDSINLGNSKNVTIKGPVELYITGDITLNNSAKIEVDDSVPNSSLTVYFAGDFEAKNSSEINNETQVPENLKLYGLDTTASLDFKNGSALYGVIYAPNADIVYHNSVDIYGSVVGNSMDIRNSATLYYDASLRDMTNDVLVSLKVGRWTE